MTFIPGKELSRMFFQQAVQPILKEQFPNLPYSAALIGSGSEVLGFDTEMSSDHHWGPRVMLFLSPQDYEVYRERINEIMRHHLPYQIAGYATNFTPPDPNDNGTQLLEIIEEGPINHRVEIFTIQTFFKRYIAFDIDTEIDVRDWLTFSEQKLRTIVSGAIYHDDLGLQSTCEQFTYYPHDVWLLLLTTGWTRIAQEEHLMGRAGYAGDEIGSALIGSRLVRDIMRLCFLMEKTYAPYAKWFGTAFAQLNCADELIPILKQGLAATTWQKREQYLSQAYAIIAQMHNHLDITEPLPTEVSNFWGRPFQVIHAGTFADAIREKIQDPAVKQLANKTNIGSIDQFSDSTDLLSDAGLRKNLRSMYDSIIEEV